MKVGFIGAGQMGRPMIGRLVAAGHEVTVHARRPEVADDLRRQDLTVLGDVAGTVHDAEVVVLCVFDDAQLLTVMLDENALPALRPGAVVVSHVTGSPTTARRMQDAAPDGVAVLDVPISGTAAGVERGSLTLLVGGDVDALEVARPVLAAYGEPILHVGGLGDGQLLKLLNNTLFSATFRAACDAAIVAERLGIPHDRFVDVIRHCSGDSFALQVLAAAPASALAPAVARYLRKDVAAARDAAGDVGIDLGRLGDWADWFDE